MYTITFELYTKDFFVECELHTDDPSLTVSELRALPNVRNIKW
jgi:hypothetical protein